MVTQGSWNQGAGGLVQPCFTRLRQRASYCRRRSFNDRIARDGHVFNERRGSISIQLASGVGVDVWRKLMPKIRVYS